jgi:hypothetical protein
MNLLAATNRIDKGMKEKYNSPDGLGAKGTRAQRIIDPNNRKTTFGHFENVIRKL